MTAADSPAWLAPESSSAPASWPAPWRELFARTKSAPILWTYGELGRDLSGSGDAARGAALRRLIGGLGLRRGSSTFWPLSLPDLDSATEGPSLFSEGLRLLRPRVVIMLGADAPPLSGLPLALTPPYAQNLHEGRLFVLVPDFAVIAAKPGAEDQVSAFLKSALSGMAGLL